MLNIYRASAGAGKTHLLTGEYIKLLYNCNEHETRFDEILAVTFTNKSTAEMKSRIVNELYVLSCAPTESDYYTEIKALEPKVYTDEKIQDDARRFISAILNNYSDFAISTIDSFFQKVLRCFVRELDIQCNYEVELNSDRILELAVTNFLDKLDSKKRSNLFDWMYKFSEKKIEEGAGWRLEKDLLQLCKSVLTKEEYRTKSEQIKAITDDKDWLNGYIDILKSITKTTSELFKESGEKGIEALLSEGFSVNDFSGGARGKMRILQKWADGNVEKLDDKYLDWALDENQWYTKTYKGQRLSAETTQKVKNIFSEIIDFQNKGGVIEHNTAKTILENIYQLGILADIDQEVTEICNEEGSMLLSSSTELLNKVIGEDDAPFIYEKTGTRIHNFMIDEFQDTSSMQWNNFKSLIENSLADGRDNLIVGDVKQSIYRWRGSDWGLLHSGLKTFAPGESIEHADRLDTNYRSQKEIIEFNNEFFKYSSSVLSQTFNHPDIENIYNDVAQAVPKKKENDVSGSVSVKFIKVQKGEKFEELAMAQLPKAVMELQDAGFQAKDIAILCRKKAMCKKAAEELLKFKNNNPEAKNYIFDIISSEALLLDTRHIVQTILSILRFIQNPKSKILRSIAACNYLQLEDLDQNNSVKKYFGGYDYIDEFLEYANRPLYDMVEGIISRLPSISKDISYVQAFRDIVLEFANGKKSDIGAFLEWWESKKADLFINTPEEQNAIRIMTIHKSKGLGMPAIILPCCEGTTDIESKNRDILWCTPDKAPFSKDGLFLPIKCSSSLKDTIFAKEFEAERLKAIIDNLNTIYVSFTRAKEAMVMFAPVPSANKTKEGENSEKDANLENLLANFLKTQYERVIDKDKEINDFIIGALGRSKKSGSHGDDFVETISQPTENIIVRKKLPRLSLKHDRLTKDIAAIERGNCIHEVLSVINDYDNIDKPIEEIYSTGKVDASIHTCEEMKQVIRKLLANEDVKRWFAPGLTILNERTILANVIQKDGRTKTLHRPDRIIIDGNKVTIIDYKTGEQNPYHHRQVREYMAFMKEMGFTNVEGYLWYITPHQIVKVKDKASNKA